MPTPELHKTVPPYQSINAHWLISLWSSFLGYLDTPDMGPNLADTQCNIMHMLEKNIASKISFFHTKAYYKYYYYVHRVTHIGQDRIMK